MSDFELLSIVITIIHLIVFLMIELLKSSKK